MYGILTNVYHLENIKNNEEIIKEDNYKYYQFIDGGYFRVNPKDKTFYVINNNEWEATDSITNLKTKYEEITDSSKLKALMNLPTKIERKRK